MPVTKPGSLDVAQANVRLPTGFTRPHHQVIHRYLRGQESLSGDDWPLLIQAMDTLRRAEVVQGRRRETFAAIYDRLVDAAYSDSLIEQLLHLANPESEGESLRAATSRRMLTDLRTANLWRADLPDSQLLVAQFHTSIPSV